MTFIHLGLVVLMIFFLTVVAFITFVGFGMVGWTRVILRRSAFVIHILTVIALRTLIHFGLAAGRLHILLARSALVIHFLTVIALRPFIHLGLAAVMLHVFLARSTFVAFVGLGVLGGMIFTFARSTFVAFIHFAFIMFFAMRGGVFIFRERFSLCDFISLGVGRRLRCVRVMLTLVRGNFSYRFGR